MALCTAPHCGRPTQLYLCDDCTTTLENMLDQIPWLLDELDARIQNLDRIPHGTIGRNRRPGDTTVIDFDAAETARNTRKLLLQWVAIVAERHTGRKPPITNTIATRDLARWLQVNTPAIARLNIAGKLYHDINHLVGADQKGGHLVASINRIQRHFAGLCPTTRGHNQHGEPIECGEALYADAEDRTITCPACKQPINIEENRRRTEANRDLQTRDQIAEILTNIGEPVPDKQLDGWISSRRLRPHGWLHQGRMMKFRIRSTDPAVYSLKRARKLRARDTHLRQEAKTP